MLHTTVVLIFITEIPTIIYTVAEYDTRQATFIQTIQVTRLARCYKSLKLLHAVTIHAKNYTHGSSVLCFDVVKNNQCYQII